MEFTALINGRLDTQIAAQGSALSRTKIQKAIKNGLVTVNGTVHKKQSHHVSAGDLIAISTDDQSAIGNRQSAIQPFDQQLEVLYEDDALMVINKPEDIVVHPGHASDPNEPTLLNGIAFLFEQRSIPFSADSTLVHRLDKPTTGCIIVAKNDASFAELQKQFEARTTKKTYLAVVFGIPEHAEATIDSPIGRNLTDRTKMSILKTSVSRDAKTSYHVCSQASDIALLQCNLHTGRTHQIRVHLSSIGHPILGDDMYGSSVSKKLSQHYGVSGLCLHAQCIGFVSPADNTEHCVSAPISATISQICTRTGLEMPSD